MVKIKKELTPAHLRCAWGTCPAVYLLSDGDFLIIGKKLSKELSQEIAHRVAGDEFAIKLNPEFFAMMPDTQDSEK